MEFTTATQIELDRTGFPMIWLEPFDVLVNFLPITKIQFEYFLCDRIASQGFDQKWYLDRLNVNPRCSPMDVDSDNFENALMTAIDPEREIKNFTRWFSAKKFVCHLPSNDEWTEIYKYCKQQPAIPDSTWDSIENLNPRARDVLQSLRLAKTDGSRSKSPFRSTQNTQATSTRMLSHQMLLDEGIYEWVEGASGFGARGAVVGRLGGQQADASKPDMYYINQNGTRPPDVGIRLILQKRN